MLKRVLTLAIFSSLPLYAYESDFNEYMGKVSDIYIGKSSTIKINVLTDEENQLECLHNDDDPWPLSFESGESYSDKWFDTLNLVRRTQETIRIGYTPSVDTSCAIEYLMLAKGDGVVPGDDISDSLTRTGQFGNIALIYTNNLVESSYTASSYYGADEAAAAFDGYTFNEQVSDDVGSLINRGIWLTKKDTSVNDAEYWLQIKFDDIVSVTGFRILVNAKSVELGRGPRSITIEVSDDGENFVEKDSYTLSKSVDQRANFSEGIELQYFRVKVNSNYGDAYIEIDELEVYADQ